MNLWLVPVEAKNWWRILIGVLVYSLSFLVLISGVPLELNLPELGKFINIFAGVEMSFGKWLFVYARRQQLSELILDINDKSKELRKRSQNDANLKQLRNQFYVQEMLVFLLTTFFGIIFASGMFIQVLCFRPVEFVVPMRAPFNIESGSVGFWCCFWPTLGTTIFVTLFITAGAMMIGNLYNQLTLHLVVLDYDLKCLDKDETVTTDDMLEHFRIFIREFQEIQRLTNKCKACMRPFLMNNLIATMVAVTFCCVELGIMINEDKSQCLKPALYFMFLNIPFFYWCWLGNRLSEKVG